MVTEVIRQMNSDCFYNCAKREGIVFTCEFNPEKKLAEIYLNFFGVERFLDTVPSVIRNCSDANWHAAPPYDGFQLSLRKIGSNSNVFIDQFRIDVWSQEQKRKLLNLESDLFSILKLMFKDKRSMIKHRKEPFKRISLSSDIEYYERVYDQLRESQIKNNAEDYGSPYVAISLEEINSKYLSSESETWLAFPIPRIDFIYLPTRICTNCVKNAGKFDVDEIAELGTSSSYPPSGRG